MNLLAGEGGTFNHNYSNIYGHGFLDIRAALLPIGTPTVILANGAKVPVSEAGFLSGSAMGDAVKRALSDVDLAVADSLGGGFVMAGAALTGAPRPQTLSSAMMSDAMYTDLSRARVAPLSAGRLAFADHSGETLRFEAASGGLSATLLLPQSGEEYGLEVTKSVARGDTRFDFGIKAAHDDGRLLGFGEEGSEMVALRLGMTHEGERGGFVSLGAEFGLADINAPRALSNVSNARFDSFGAEIGRRGMFALGDRISLGLSLPMAVTEGSAELALMTSAEGRATYQPVAIDLAPSERQVDISVKYMVPMSARSEVMIELVHAENHGNQAGQRDTAGVLGLRFTF